MNEELKQYIRELTNIKNDIIRLNDYLVLNMNTETSKTFNQYLTNKISEINNLIENIKELELLLDSNYFNNSL